MIAKGHYGPLKALVIAGGDPPSIDAPTLDNVLNTVAANLGVLNMRLVLVSSGSQITVRIRRRRWWRPN